MTVKSSAVLAASRLRYSRPDKHRIRVGGTNPQTDTDSRRKLERSEWRRRRERKKRKTEVIKNNDVVEIVVGGKPTKTIIPINVLETVEKGQTIIPIQDPTV